MLDQSLATPQELFHLLNFHWYLYCLSLSLDPRLPLILALNLIPLILDFMVAQILLILYLSVPQLLNFHAQSTLFELFKYLIPLAQFQQ